MITQTTTPCTVCRRQGETLPSGHPDPASAAHQPGKVEEVAVSQLGGGENAAAPTSAQVLPVAVRGVGLDGAPGRVAAFEVAQRLGGGEPRAGEGCGGLAAFLARGDRARCEKTDCQQAAEAGHLGSVRGGRRDMVNNPT